MLSGGGAAKPHEVEEGGEQGPAPIQHTPIFGTCSYAGDDFVCAVTIGISGGVSPYTLWFNSERIGEGAGYFEDLLFRGRRCNIAFFEVIIQDSSGMPEGQVLQSWSFDPDVYAGRFPGGRCELP